MNLLHRAEDFLMNRFAGKLIARGATSLGGTVAALAVAWLGSDQAQAALAKGLLLGGPILDAVGVHISTGPVNQAALGAAIGGVLVGGAQAAFEWFKARRAANPNSPTVQTDPSKPGADPVAIPGL